MSKNLNQIHFWIPIGLRAYDGVFVYVYVADVREMNRTAFEMESEMESGLVIIGGNHFGMI